MSIQKITPNLWFDRQAEDAAKLYTSIFKNSAIGKTMRYGKEGFEVHKMPEGTVMTIEFELEGQKFMALNGGPVFTFNESVSFVVSCDTQEEIDYYWNKLGEGGDPESQQCGWMKDKFGVSWQIVPATMGKLLSQSPKVMRAMLQMKKIVIADLEKAAEK